MLKIRQQLVIIRKFEIVYKRDVVVQLKASEIVIKEFFKDLLIELKGFKYQITLAALSRKVKNNFNSLTKVSLILINLV